MTRLLAIEANHTCHIGRKCCDYDKRPTAQIRRSQRRRENQKWKKEN